MSGSLRNRRYDLETRSRIRWPSYRSPYESVSVLSSERFRTKSLNPGGAGRLSNGSDTRASSRSVCIFVGLIGPDRSAPRRHSIPTVLTSANAVPMSALCIASCEIGQGNTHRLVQPFPGPCAALAASQRPGPGMVVPFERRNTAEPFAGQGFTWNGRRDPNQRPSPWQDLQTPRPGRSLISTHCL